MPVMYRNDPRASGYAVATSLDATGYRVSAGFGDFLRMGGQYILDTAGRELEKRLQPCGNGLVRDLRSGQCVTPAEFRGDGDDRGKCPSGTIAIPGTNRCADIQPGGDTQGGGLLISNGEVVQGRYGPAIVPDVDETIVRRCPADYVLGADNLCYAKNLKGLRRKWKKGMRPLLTGGERKTLRRADTIRAALQREGLTAPKPKKRKKRKVAC